MYKSIKEIRRENFIFLIENVGTDAEFSRRYQLNDRYVRQLKTGRENSGRDIGDRMARTIEKKIGLPEFAMDHPLVPDIQSLKPALPVMVLAEDEVALGRIRFPIWDITVAAGHGAQVEDYPQPVHSIDVSEEWVKQHIRVPLIRVRAISVRGQSMWPDINHGDILFVDESIKQYETDAIYTFNWRGEALVKRLQYMRGSQCLVIVSSNPAFKPDPIPPEEMDQLYVTGRALGALPWQWKPF